MRVLTLGLLLASTIARADVVSTPPSAPTPAAESPLRTAWRDLGGGDESQIQSGLLCPPRLRQYTRTLIKTFDRFGLDIGCNYQALASDITIYLTRRDGGSVDAAMAEAKREFGVGRAGEHPKAIEGAPGAGGSLAWQVALFDTDRGVREGIWVADLHGWTLEYRVTYRPENEASQLADLTAFTDLAGKSAGAHLASCDRSPPPPRSGTPMRDAKTISDTAMMSSLLGGIAGADIAKGKAVPEAPLIWCAETRLGNNEFPLLFSRAVTPDGDDGHRDQIRLMSDDATPVLTVGPDTDALVEILAEADHKAGALGSTDGKPETWTATVQSKGRTLIYAYFAGRPPVEAAARLYATILQGTAKPIGGYGVDGKKVEIFMPPADKK